MYLYVVCIYILYYRIIVLIYYIYIYVTIWYQSDPDSEAGRASSRLWTRLSLLSHYFNHCQCLVDCLPYQDSSTLNSSRTEAVNLAGAIKWGHRSFRSERAIVSFRGKHTLHVLWLWCLHCFASCVSLRNQCCRTCAKCCWKGSSCPV